MYLLAATPLLTVVFGLVTRAQQGSHLKQSAQDLHLHRVPTFEEAHAQPEANKPTKAWSPFSDKLPEYDPSKYEEYTWSCKNSPSGCVAASTVINIAGTPEPTPDASNADIWTDLDADPEHHAMSVWENEVKPIVNNYDGHCETKVIHGVEYVECDAGLLFADKPGDRPAETPDTNASEGVKTKIGVVQEEQKAEPEPEQEPKKLGRWSKLREKMAHHG